jgi:translocation and assembly module TamB
MGGQTLNWRRAIPWSAWALSIFLVGFLYETQWPKFVTWARVEVAKQTRQHTPLQVLPGSVKFHFFPPGISVTDIRLTPNPEMQKYFKAVQVGRIHVSLNPWQFAQGRVQISEVLLERIGGTVNIPTRSGAAGITAKQLLELPKKLGLPLETIRVRDVNMKLDFPDEGILASLLSFDGELNIDPNIWSLEVQTPQIHVRRAQDAFDFALSVRGGARLLADRLQVVNLYAKQGNSIVRVNGEILGDILQKKDFSQDNVLGFASVQALVDAPGFVSWWNKRFETQQLPEAQGSLKISVKAEQPAPTKLTAVLQLETTKFAVDGYRVGNLKTTGSLKDGTIDFSELRLDSQAGPVTLEAAKFNIKPPYAFSAMARVPNLDLHQLLMDIRVGDIPLDLGLQGDVDCRGQVSPAKLSCEGTVKGQELKIWANRDEKKVIVHVPTFEARGKANLDATRVQFETDLQMPNSKGQSHGTVIYAQGFAINYKADMLDFRDVADLSGLKVEGRGPVEGSTKGDSRAATFDLRAKLTDAWLSDFALGEVESDVSYKTGRLYFNGANGKLGTSPYRADVTVDFTTNRLKVVGGSTQINVVDALTAFDRKFKFPSTAVGQGTVEAEVEGPFQFNRLNYDFKATVYRGAVAGESFDRLTFHVRSKDGEVRSENIQLLKNKSIATAVGEGHPNGDIDVRIEGRNFRLDESEAVAQIDSNISGSLNFDMRLTGYVLAPETQLRVKIPQMYLAEEPLGASDSKIRITSKTFEGDGDFLGHRVQSEFSFPYKPGAPFRLKAHMQDFDFSILAALLVGPGDRQEFASVANADVDLVSNNGGFWNSSGHIHIHKLALRRGQQQIYVKRPVQWRIQNGYWDIDKTLFEGQGTTLSISSNKPAKRKVDLGLVGKVNAGVFHLLTPFLGDMRGSLSINGQIRADENGFDLFGTGFLEKSLIKIKNFPHPFQNLRADLTFNQRRITANSLNSEFAGGSLVGEGHVDLIGSKNIPLKFTARMNEAELAVPDGVKSRASGDLEITGSWFPFIMKGNVYIKSGLMTREFTQAKSTETTILPSVYLPQTVSLDQNAPLKFALNTDIARDFLVKNQMMDSAVYGNLKVEGTPNQPQLTGVINAVRGGKIFFRENEFEIITATATFIDGNTKDPKMYIAAINRFDDGTQIFDINLLLLGTAQKPDLRLSSQPPMTQEEIVSLLALGVRPEKFERNFNEGRQGIQAGTKLGTALFADNALKKEIQNKTGFQLDIGSATQRNVVSAQRNQAVDDTTGVSVPKIVVSRQWTPKFGASASRTVGNAPISNVQFRYKLNRSFSVIGRWENREIEDVRTTTRSAVDTNSLFGVDLEYKVEFK